MERSERKKDLTLRSERHWILRQEGLVQVSHHVHLKHFKPASAQSNRFSDYTDFD